MNFSLKLIKVKQGCYLTFNKKGSDTFSILPLSIQKMSEIKKKKNQVPDFVNSDG